MIISPPCIYCGAKLRFKETRVKNGQEITDVNCINCQALLFGRVRKVKSKWGFLR